MDEDLLLFIKGVVRSVWALEILLFLRERRERAWSKEQLAKEMRSNVELVRSIFSSFELAGLLRCRADGFIYEPASEYLDDLSARLEQVYRERPVAVINTIVSSRNGPIQSLADAFRVKGPRR